MFIVEGLDYAGKSTALARVEQIVKEQRWSRWFKSERIHQIQAWGKLDKDFDYCRAYILSAHMEQLCDRFVLSELAYGEVFRNGPNPKFDSHARRRVQRELNVTGSVTLLVRADWRTTERRAAERCKSEFDAAMKVRQTYENMTSAFYHALDDITVGRRGGSYLGEYDTSDIRSFGLSSSEHELVVRELFDWYVMQWRTHVERSQLVQRMCPQSWGYLWPKILFVGENINHATATRPFAGDQGASRTLSDLLDLADIGEKETYYWNAYRHNGAPLLTREGVTTLQPKLIVALGNEAHQCLEWLKIPHVNFPHPQWIGRFHRKEMIEWGAKLKSLVAPALQSST